MKNKLKIFCIYYYKINNLYKSNCIEPIYAGNHPSSMDDNIILHDNVKNNIADKNYNYGELTTHYWVWKTYLEENPDLQYVGFCHYRRFLIFEKPATYHKCFHSSMSFKNFNKFFERYTTENIYPIIKDYDIVLPEKHVRNNYTYYDNLNKYPSKITVDLVIKIIKENYPELLEEVQKYFFNRPHEKYLCLNFVMKRELFQEYATWMFELLEKVEKTAPKECFAESRELALIAEQFFTIWLNNKINTSNIKVLNRKSIRLRSLWSRFLRNVKRFPKKVLALFKRNKK